MSQTPADKPALSFQPRDITPPTAPIPPAVIPEPDEHASSPMSGSARTGLLITIALLAASYHGTFREMWVRWFPAWVWDDPNITLMDRLSEGDSYYSHGPVVPFVSLIIAWMISRRVGFPTLRTRSSTIVGTLILTGSLLMHLVSVKARVTFVSGFSFIGVWVGLTMLWGGWALLRAYWLPLAFLFFMVPLPMEHIYKLNFVLKNFAGDLACRLTTALFRIPIVIDGSYVFIEGADGTPQRLVIENVCSGLRSLFSLICFAFLFALICRAKGMWRVLMLALAVPTAIASNVVRITVLNVAAAWYGVKAASPGSPAHDISGFAVFIIALGFLFGVERLILFAGRKLKRDWTDERLLGYLDEIPRTPETPRTLRPIPLAGLALTCALTFYIASLKPGQNVGNVAAKAVPAAITINGVELNSVSYELDRKTLTILETDDYLFRVFNNPDGSRAFDLLIVFSANNRKGTHPPEVCLEGGGDQIVVKRNDTVTTATGRRVELRGLSTQRGASASEHVYLYKCGDSYTTSFFWQQFTIFVNGLLQRNTAGALIRFTVPVRNEDRATARAEAQAAAAAVLPEIDKGLP